MDKMKPVFEALNKEFVQANLTLTIICVGGYVTRIRNPENHREVLVGLTDFAREHLVTNPPAHHLPVKAQMEAILSPAEQVQLSTLLDKLVSGLEKITF